MTFCRTFNQGRSACFWKTTPRSAPGPAIGVPPKGHLAMGRLNEAGKQVQERCLAAARSAKRNNEIARPHGERNFLQRVNAFAQRSRINDGNFFRTQQLPSHRWLLTIWRIFSRVVLARLGLDFVL